MRSSIPAANLGVILIWSTTPLAIKWSGDGVGFLFGAVSRMSLGFLCVFAVTCVRRQSLRWDVAAVKAYAAAAIGIYGAMISVYWGAQYIPSGWVAIVFGLSPLVTALLATVLLHERAPSRSRLAAQALGLCGLAVVFHSGIAIGFAAALGILAVVVSTFLHALSAVLLKRLDTDLPATTLVSGGLLFALVPYYATWWLLDGEVPLAVPTRTAAAIVYLGVFATTFGFALYYYILKHLSPTQVALITFVSPISALLLGNALNGEPFEARILAGAALVLAALFMHEIVPALRRPRLRAATAKCA